MKNAVRVIIAWLCDDFVEHESCKNGDRFFYKIIKTLKKTLMIMEHLYGIWVYSLK